MSSGKKPPSPSVAIVTTDCAQTHPNTLTGSSQFSKSRTQGMNRPPTSKTPTKPRAKTPRNRSPNRAKAEEKTESDDPADLDEAIEDLRRKRNIDLYKLVTDPGRIMHWKMKGKIDEFAEGLLDALVRRQSLKPRKIWDEELYNLQLSKKTPDQFSKEVSQMQDLSDAQFMSRTKHSYPPTDVTSLWVQKKKELRHQSASKKGSERQSIRVKKKVSSPLRLVKLDSGYKGFRFNRNGELKSHSILGDVKEFRQEAYRRQEHMDVFPEQGESTSPVCSTAGNPQFPTSSTEKRRQQTNFYLARHGLANQQTALNCWPQELQYRRCMQTSLANLLQREESELLMVKSHNYVAKKTAKRRLKQGMDKVAPAIPFWMLRETVGDDQLYMTFTKGERGELPTVEVQSGDPLCISEMKGLGSLDKSGGPFLQSAYLQQQDQKLGGVIKVDNKALFEDLCLSGHSVQELQDGKWSREACAAQSDCKPSGDADSKCDKHPEDTDENRNNRHPQLSITLNSKKLYWCGTNGFDGDVASLETTIFMKTEVGQLATQYLELQNTGSVAVRFNWKRVETPNPLHLHSRTMRPFYFNSNNGILLSQDSRKIPVVFFSRTTCWCYERWTLDTEPVLCGGTPITVTFRGQAYCTKNFDREIEEVEALLSKRVSDKESRRVVRGIFDGILYDVCYKETDAYKPPTEEELFKLANPGLHYNPFVIGTLRKLFNETVEGIKSGILVTARYSKLTDPIGPSDLFNVKKCRKSFSEGRTMFHDEKRICVTLLDNVRDNVLKDRRLFLTLTEDEVEGESDVPDKEEVVSSSPFKSPASRRGFNKMSRLVINRRAKFKRKLLGKLSDMVTSLQCKSLYPIMSEAQFRYIVVLGLLQRGVEAMERHAWSTAITMGLCPKELENLGVYWSTDRKAEVQTCVRSATRFIQFALRLFFLYSNRPKNGTSHSLSLQLDVAPTSESNKDRSGVIIDCMVDLSNGMDQAAFAGIVPNLVRGSPLKKEDAKTASDKGKHGKDQEKSCSQLQFSAVKVYRQLNQQDKGRMANLRKYDEKVFIQVFGMLQEVADEIELMFQEPAKMSGSPARRM